MRPALALAVAREPGRDVACHLHDGDLGLPEDLAVGCDEEADQLP